MEQRPRELSSCHEIVFLFGAHEMPLLQKLSLMALGLNKMMNVTSQIDYDGHW
jgi:hypothetical protein